MNFISSARNKKGIKNNDSLIWKRKLSSYFVIKPLHTKETTLIWYQMLKTQSTGHFRCKWDLYIYLFFFFREFERKLFPEHRARCPCLWTPDQTRLQQSCRAHNLISHQSSAQMSCGVYELDSVVWQLTSQPKLKSGQKQVLKHDH